MREPLEDVFGPCTVIEEVCELGLWVGLTDKDEYVLVYRSNWTAESYVDFYTRISERTLQELRTGAISVREVLRNGETYRVQKGSFLYRPRKDEIPTKDAEYDWKQEGSDLSFGPEGVKKNGKSVPWSSVPTRYLDVEIAPLKEDRGGYGLSFQERRLLKLLLAERARRPHNDDIEPDPNYWETRDGRRVKISEMDTEHLHNVLNMFGALVETSLRAQVRENMECELATRARKESTSTS